MKPLGRFCSAGLLLMWTGLAGAQETAAAVATPMGGTLAKRQVSFTFDRKAVAVSHYKLVVHEDGSGLYEGNEIPSATSYGHPADVSAVPFKHVITVSQATAQKIMQHERRRGGWRAIRTFFYGLVAGIAALVVLALLSGPTP